MQDFLLRCFQKVIIHTPFFHTCTHARTHILTTPDASRAWNDFDTSDLNSNATLVSSFHMYRLKGA